MFNFTKKMLFATLVLASNFVHADAPLFTLPTDTKLVQFTYDKYDTYTILTKPFHVTDLEFGSDEIILGKALGDPVLWKADDGGERHLMIRPSKSNLETSLTVLTDKRVYQFTLRSSPEDGKWYQHVEWSHPDKVMKDKLYAETLLKEKQEKSEAIAKTVLIDDVAVDNFYTDYKITGSEEIKPSMVMDDGNRTSIRFNRKQDIPAIFVKGDDAKYAMVNYDISDDGRTAILHRVVDVIFLKLGKKEVVIDRVDKVHKKEKTESFRKNSFFN